MARCLLSNTAPDFQPQDRVRTPSGEGTVLGITGGVALVGYFQVCETLPLDQLEMVCRPVWQEADGTWRHVSRSYPGRTYKLWWKDGELICPCQGFTAHGTCFHRRDVWEVMAYMAERDNPTPDPDAPAPAALTSDPRTWELRESASPADDTPPEIAALLRSTNEAEYDRGLDLLFSTRPPVQKAA